MGKEEVFQSKKGIYIFFVKMENMYKTKEKCPVIKSFWGPPDEIPSEKIYLTTNPVKM